MRRPMGWLLVCVALAGAGCSKQTTRVALPAPETEIVLAYNSDEKGDFEECACKTARLGGIARRATALRGKRAEHAHVLPVHGGGWSVQGSLESQRVQSFFHLRVMGQLGYAAVNVAPPDLSYGVEALRQAARDHGVKLVASNLKSKSADGWVFEPYIITEVAGIRIGFLGLMEDGEPLGREGEDLMTLDPQLAAEALLPELRQKADVVVAFAHLGQRKTQELVDEVEGIDIAISGKDGFVNYQPTVVGGDSTAKCLVVEGGDRGKYLGALSVVVSEHGKILRYSNAMTALDRNVADDSTVAAQVVALKEQLKEIRKREAVDQVVGSEAQP